MPWQHTGISTAILLAPTMLQTSSHITPPPPQRQFWSLKKADWVKFKNTQAALHSTCHPSQDLDSDCHNLAKIIREAALATIPKTGLKHKYGNYLWYNTACKEANHKASMLIKTFHKSKCKETLASLRDAQKHAKTVMQTERDQYWLKWCNGLNYTSGVDDM